jgi:hypothetical protein
MNVMVAPDGKPAQFDGQAWVSQDRKYWWNGAAWQRIGRRRGPNLFVIVIGVLILGAVGLVVTGVIRPTTPPPPPRVVIGVTNMKIDSPTQVEFDYARSSNCFQLRFDITFYDKAGRALDRYLGDVQFVSAGVTHHYVFHTDHTIATGSVRFVATPTCFN